VIRFGVIGTGFGSKVQLPALKRHPQTQIVSVCSRRDKNASEAAEAYAVPHWTTSYGELLELEPDAVIVSTPPHLHMEIVLSAASRGIHVICEKPMALDLREAEAMLDAANEAGIVHMMDFEFRFLPVRAAATRLIKAGYVGVPLMTALSQFGTLRADPYSYPWDWWSQASKGGGAIGAAASHQVDALRVWLGEVSQATGFEETFVKHRATADGEALRAVTADDTYCANLRFDSGAVANLVYSSAVHHARLLEILIFGTEGSLRLEADQKLFGGRKGEPEAELPVPEELYQIPGGMDERDLEFSYWLEPAFLRLLDRLVTAIQDGTPVDGPTFGDGVAVQRVLDSMRST